MSIAMIRKEPTFHPLDIPHNDLFRGALSVVKTLQQAGYEAYLVGGAIRDLWMGTPPEDCDITTNAHPEDVIRLFSRTIPVGVQFGTVMVLQNNHPFEVTTFRADGRYEDGRRPSSVSFSTRVVDDLERRDLTINGLIYGMNSGEILDYTGGIEDIQRRMIRTIGPPQDRFAEDRLRMLRAVRFATRLNFDIDVYTSDAIRIWAPKLHDVSVERIQQEFLKIMQCRYPARGIQLLHHTQLLTEILPELPSPTAAVSRLSAYENQSHKKDSLAFAVLLSEIPAVQSEAILQRLRFSRDLTTAVTTLLARYPIFCSYSSMSPIERKKFIRQADIQDLLAFADILQEQDSRSVLSRQQAQQDLAQWTERDLYPPRILDGNKLRQLGYKPGPHFTLMLQAVEEQQLQGNLETLEHIVAWLETHFADRKG